MLLTSLKRNPGDFHVPSESFFFINNAVKFFSELLLFGLPLLLFPLDVVLVGSFVLKIVAVNESDRSDDSLEITKVLAQEEGHVIGLVFLVGQGMVW